MNRDEEKILTYILGCLVRGIPDGEEEAFQECFDWLEKEFLPPILDNEEHPLHEKSVKVKEFVESLRKMSNE